MSATETREGGLLTIGAVCERLKDEFPDISISKIRYLEGEGLVTPKRTQGGYRLFSEDDMDRLETILRLQRDEFLPLRVIREELAAARPNDRRRRRSRALEDAETELGLEELCAAAGVDATLARELEEFGLVKPRVQAGQRLYAEADVDVAAACGQLASYGIAPRHLRQFATAVGREVALLETFAAPALRARNPQRRQQALADLHRLAELAQELAQRLYWRDVRRLVS
jgi:DNA-binding transcriptional MerR regulator